jgi:hypothetical protein
MVIEKPIMPIWQWLFGGPATAGGEPISGAVGEFLQATWILALLGLTIGLLITIFRYGPRRGWQNFVRVLLQSPRDLLGISPRRVAGLAYLAMRETFHRRVWVALLLFFLILMFAGWNLAPESDQPAVLYLNFVLSAATYIMLPVAVFTAAFSLPQDIKKHTIYTVVTKPVRPSEIVLGRILGFSLVATILLAIMALASYLFVARGLDHTHQLAEEQLVAESFRGKPIRYEGETSLVDRHRHDVQIEAADFFPEIELATGGKQPGIVVSRVGVTAAAAGLQAKDRLEAIDGRRVTAERLDEAIRELAGMAGSQVTLSIERGEEQLLVDVPRTILETVTETNRGHKHRVLAHHSEQDAGKVRYELGPAEGMFVARVPQYGSLRFRDSKGDPKDETTWTFTEQGVNIGKVFSYRTYIRGNTLAAAIWTFDNLTPENYPQGLDLDVNIRVYRSYVGKIDAPIAGSLFVRNPDTGKRSQERIFSGKEFTIDQMRIPRKVWSSEDELVDLFADGLVTPDGRVEVWMSCVDPGQYFGMAEADVYIRARDASYTVNFIKGFLGIELQVILVTALAVLFSTFLSGPVAMLLSFTAVLLGFNKDFLNRLAQSVLDPERAMQLASYKRIYGGGPIESFYRIITQRNLTSKLDEGALRTTIENIDYSMMFVVDKILHLLPDFEQFLEVKYLSYGYEIPADMLLQHAFAVLSFLFATYVIGYFVLKSREMAR